MQAIVANGHSVIADRRYMPGEQVEIRDNEAPRLLQAGVIILLPDKQTPKQDKPKKGK